METWWDSVFLFNFRTYRLFFHQVYFRFPYGNRHMPALNKKPCLLHQGIGSRNGWQIALGLSMLSLLLLVSADLYLSGAALNTQHTVLSTFYSAPKESDFIALILEIRETKISGFVYLVQDTQSRKGRVEMDCGYIADSRVVFKATLLS